MSIQDRSEPIEIMSLKVSLLLLRSLKVSARVTMKVSTRSIKLYLNSNTMIGNFVFSNDIMTGSAFLLTSPPSKMPASAHIEYDASQTIFQSNAAAINPALLNEVSSKYAISFNITPNGANSFSLFDRQEVGSNNMKFRIPGKLKINFMYSIFIL